MRLSKESKKWIVTIEDQDNQLGLLNINRFLEDINDAIVEEEPDKLILEIDLNILRNVNSELIAQFVMLQNTIVRFDGRLRIVNTNPKLKTSFDVVMLDKIINIQYSGLVKSKFSEEE